MSVQAITAAIAIQGVSPTEKLLLIALANYADKDGRCFPSQKTLAEDTCLSDRSIRTILTDLVERGLLDRQERRRADGSRATDLITLRLDQPEASSGGAEVVSGGVRKQLPGGAEAASALTTFEPSSNQTDADDTGADAWPNAQIVETLIAEVGSPRLDHTKSHGLVLSSGRLMAWKAAGAKWRRDVVPTITACCARSTGPIRSWSYFDGAIADAIANNTRALEIPEARPHERPHADPKTAKRTANDANNARAFAAARALAQQRAE